jgi:hypothetical protein
MENEFMSRGYLLPEGCKDLIDVLKLNLSEQQPLWQSAVVPLAPLPPLKGELAVKERMTVSELAEVLGQIRYRIVADLIEMGVFATLNHSLDFSVIARVVRKYGYTAIKVG